MDPQSNIKLLLS